MLYLKTEGGLSFLKKSKRYTVCASVYFYYTPALKGNCERQYKLFFKTAQKFSCI